MEDAKGGIEMPLRVQLQWVTDVVSVAQIEVDAKEVEITM